MGVPFVDAIQQTIVNEVYGCLKERCSILINYKENMKKLDDEKQNLEEQRATIDERVREAEVQGHIIEEKVSKWRKNVEDAEKEVDELMESKSAKENIKCFRFSSCPNFVSRYRLSKKALEKTKEVRNLASEGSNLTPVSRLPPPPPELQFPSSIAKYKDFGSRVAVLEEIKKAMKENNNIVGIHGAGGTGKTTMAAEIGRQLQSEGYFYEVTMAVVSKDVNISKIQDQLAAGLEGFSLSGVSNETERAKQLWNRLKNGKSNLVILDDLWKKLNPKDIGIPDVGDGNVGCCKLLLTSRNSGVWKSMSSVDHHEQTRPVKEFRINELTEPEAWELFKNHAGDSIESSSSSFPELRLTASQICKRCGGLPVAIRAVGEALRDKDLREWRDALHQLENSKMEKIVDIELDILVSLKLSYDMLSSSEAQKCFLLCCLFPDDAEIPIEDLVMHCKAARFVATTVGGGTMEETRDRVYTLIKLLKTRCLLLDVPDKECVKVHDVIRDVGLSISQKEDSTLRIIHGLQDMPAGSESSSSFNEKSRDKRPRTAYSALYVSWTKDIKDKFQHNDDEFVCPEVDTLVLHWWSGSSSPPPKRFLSKTDGSLKALVLNVGARVSSVLFSSTPYGGSKLPNLRMLHLRSEDNKDVLKQLAEAAKMLEVLRLSGYSYIKELPAEIGLLTGLLVLDLKETGLGRIPHGVLSKLTRLQELYLHAKFTGVSLDEVSCLRQLTSLYITIPSTRLDLFFDKLERFRLCVGEGYVKTTGLRFFNKRNSARALVFEQVPIENKFYGLIGKAYGIYFEEIEGLSEVIHRTDHGFPYLEQLYVSKCNDLEYIFGGEIITKQLHLQSHAAGQLTELRIRHCHGLKYVISASCARALQQLREIEVWCCERLVAIVGGGVEEEMLEEGICFSRLNKMELAGLPQLVSFYSSVVVEEEKSTKTARWETSVGVLFSEKVSCPALEELKINNMMGYYKGAPKIKMIWDEQSYKNFPNLKYVGIYGCENIESIVANKGEEDLGQTEIVRL